MSRRGDSPDRPSHFEWRGCRIRFPSPSEQLIEPQTGHTSQERQPFNFNSPPQHPSHPQTSHSHLERRAFNSHVQHSIEPRASYFSRNNVDPIRHHQDTGAAEAFRQRCHIQNTVVPSYRGLIESGFDASRNPRIHQGEFDCAQQPDLSTRPRARLPLERRNLSTRNLAPPLVVGDQDPFGERLISTRQANAARRVPDHPESVPRRGEEDTCDHPQTGAAGASMERRRAELPRFLGEDDDEPPAAVIGAAERDSPMARTLAQVRQLSRAVQEAGESLRTNDLLVDRLSNWFIAIVDGANEQRRLTNPWLPDALPAVNAITQRVELLLSTLPTRTAAGFEDCSICMEPSKDTQVSDLPCGHWFHTECTNQWLRTNPTCPMCRARPS